MRFEPTTYSHKEYAIRHVDLTWNIHFDERYISGVANYTIDILEESSRIVLDSKSLEILSIYETETHDLFDYKVGKHDQVFGSALIIQLPEKYQHKSSLLHLSIEYNTGKNDLCTASLWLNADQTYNKQHPFMFTQCEQIHARSLMPCQDTPAIKFTYTAKIQVPSPLSAAMSAIPVRNYTEGNYNFYIFKQEVPIPSYLLAIVSGDMVYHSLDDRCGLYMERGREKEVIYEFQEIPTYLKAAETLCGPYRWSLYNMVCLPGGFAFGGMENPCLTFITPSLLSGDRSLCSVVIHEIVHSWTGNLVTNDNWGDMWLNEGFTVYLELQLNKYIFGEERRNLSYLLNVKELKSAIDSLPREYTSLYISHSTNNHEPIENDEDIYGIDPDLIFSTVMYDKGSTFLYILTEAVGGESIFEEFLRQYIATFAYKSINRNDFKQFFDSYFANETIDVDWNTWVYTPGHCIRYPSLPTTLPAKAFALAKRWVEEPDFHGDLEQFTQMSYSEKVLFIQDLSSLNPSLSLLEKVDNIYKLSTYTNSEVLFEWCQLGISHSYMFILPSVTYMLSTFGRMKFVVPLYTSLLKNPLMNSKAKEIYKENRFRYQSMCQMKVDLIMKKY